MAAKEAFVTQPARRFRGYLLSQLRVAGVFRGNVHVNKERNGAAIYPRKSRAVRRYVNVLGIPAISIQRCGRRKLTLDPSVHRFLRWKRFLDPSGKTSAVFRSISSLVTW